MTPRLHAASVYDLLKATCRDLVKAAGGQERVALVTRGSQGKISEALSPHHPERFMAIDQVADLERDVGAPVVTRLLAEMAGYELTPRSAARAKSAARHLADVISAGNAVEAGLALALADNGGLSTTEAAALLPGVRQAIHMLQHLDSQLGAVAGRPGQTGGSHE